MQKRLVALCILVACISLAAFSQTWLTFSLFVSVTAATVLTGVLCVLWVYIMLSLNHRTGTGIEHVQKDIASFHSKLMHGYDLSPKGTGDHLPVVFGRTIDHLLQQIIDFFIRDFIEFYFRQYAFKPTHLSDNIKEDIWGAIHNIYDRLSRVDHVSLLACDMVNKITMHFAKIRDAKLTGTELMKPTFKLPAHLLTAEKELDYLRQISEMFIMFLLPRSYSLPPAKFFLREILACKILSDAVDILCDPDFFNQHVITYIESQKVANLMHRKTFEYANTFEDFLKIIQKTDDVETLKGFRYEIVNKIMHATTLQNMKRAKGVDADAEKSAGVNKSELNEAKKLKRFIDQLQSAKKECECRLLDLGWDGGVQYHVLPLAQILDHVLGRKYMTQFLETMASQGLVGYWMAVEDLKVAQRKNWHQVGAEIFYTYIRNPQGEIKVNKSTRKRMEAFLLGDKGPEVFYEVQKQVWKILEEKYYQPFVNSKYYNEMVAAIDADEGITEVDGAGGNGMEERQNSGDSNTSSESNHVGEHSNYSRRKLSELQEKLNNKTQALTALHTSLKPESRVLKMLQQEVEWLQGEKRQLEAHISRTEIWGENLGKWRAIVQNAEIMDEKETPTFVIVVHMQCDDEDEEETSSGWVVSRTLTQFQELHRKLRPLCAEVKGLELPSQTFKFLFAKSEKNSLEKAKMQIQKYLEFILDDDRLNQCEAIYSFLSPSSEHLKNSGQVPKKSKFSFSTLFKSNSDQSNGTNSSLSKERESEEDDMSQYLDAPGSADYTDGKNQNGHSKTSDEGKDTVAEPLYALMDEIFDHRGFNKYLRKTLITFVQITYGRTINRQIHDIITWYFAEKQLHYYLSMLTKSFWPQGELAQKGPDRSALEKGFTANEARKMFVSNVPEILATLVGQNAARNGAKKVFDNLQNKKLNKLLFYELFEVFLIKTFPELNIDK